MSGMTIALSWAMDLLLHRRIPADPSAFDRSSVRRILVIRKDNIGDVLCTTPALRALRRAFPEAHIAVFVSHHCRAVVEGNPHVDTVYTYTKAKHRPGGLGMPALFRLMRLLLRLHACRFDLAVAMGRPCSRTAGWLAYASGARWRLGYRTKALHPFDFFLNLGQTPVMDSHEVDGCLELLATLGIAPAGRELTLVPNPMARDAVRRRLAEEGLGGGKKTALFHISSRREGSRWPLPAFARVADVLQEQCGLGIILSWAPGDARNPLFPGDDDRVEEAAKLMRVRPILLRTPELEELIAAFSLCDFALSTDGGPMHIAAALDVPQVVLFGKVGTEHWMPVSRKCVVLKRGDRVDRISVEEVLEAAIAVVSEWVGKDKSSVAAGGHGRASA